MWIWIAIGAAVIALGLFLYWAFVITEGAYLGAKVVAWTYDLTARKYDDIKQFNPVDDTWLLSMPMMKALDQVDAPLMLDVATGTGRMPQALLKRPLFRGTIVGLDFSRQMLEQAHIHLDVYQERCTLIWRDARHLPFADETFDAVSCLEALEFMPSPQRVLDEMSRVLRPGGAFLVTNRRNWERKLMPGKAFTQEQLQRMLEQAGLTQIEFRPWQVYYDLIWARKAGDRSHLGRGTENPLHIIRCARCGHLPLVAQKDTLRCPSCGQNHPLQDGIVHMAKIKPRGF